MREVSLRLPTARLSSTARIGWLANGDKQNRREAHTALAGEGAAPQTASGALSRRASSQILAMKSRGCSATTPAAPLLAE